MTTVEARRRAVQDVIELSEALGSKPASEKTPYSELYAARDALAEGVARMSEEKYEDALVARLEARLGKVALEVEEPHMAEEHLKRALRYLAPGTEALDETSIDGKDWEAEILRLANGACEDAALALNQAALLWDGRDQSKRSRALLEVSALVSANSGDAKAETEALFYLAQVHGKLGNAPMAAWYCRQTLERQLDAEGQVVGVSSREWAKNALGLSAYYQGSGRTEAADACVSAARYVSAGKDPELQADIELATARIRLAALVALADQKDAPQKAQGDGEAQKERDDDEDRRKRGVDEEAPFGVLATRASSNGEATDPLAAGLPRGPEDLFKASKNAFEAAARHYALDGHVTEHVGLARDLSRLWGTMARLETDPKRRIAMAQRRIDLLEPLRTVLNSRVYSELRAVLAFEVADVAAGLVDEKSKRIKKSPTAKAKTKACARFRDLAVTAYDDFAFCCLGGDAKTAENLDPPLVVPKDDADTFVRARFFAARLQGRLFADPDPVPRLEASLERFRAVALEARRFLDVDKIHDSDILQTELHICDEMVKLLPAKILHARSGNLIDETIQDQDDDDANTLAAATETTTTL